MSIRIALIGTGVMGMDHAHIFANELPNVELHTICDPFRERAIQAADQFGAHEVEVDPIKAVTAKEIDAVVIASPDDTHTPLTLAAMKAGKYVLCEKPLATTSQECQQVLNYEQKIGQQRVQLGFMRRFDPSYTAMKHSLTQGSIGEAILFHCFHRNVQAPDNFTGQMAISNSAPHEFDAARFMLEEEFKYITAFQPKNFDTKKVGAPVFMVLETESGRLVNVEINNNSGYGYDVRAELVGTNGTISLNTPTYIQTNLKLHASTAYAKDWRPRFAEAYRLQNQAWINSVLTKTPDITASNAWDGYCSTVIAEAGVNSLKSGEKVEIKLITKPHLYR